MKRFRLRAVEIKDGTLELFLSFLQKGIIKSKRVKRGWQTISLGKLWHNIRLDLGKNHSNELFKTIDMNARKVKKKRIA